MDSTSAILFFKNVRIREKKKKRQFCRFFIFLIDFYNDSPQENKEVHDNIILW